MKPFTVNGDVWRVIRVSAGDPRLIDRTGEYRIATTDPETMNVCVLDTLEPPLLDKVVLHEVAHAITVSYGLLSSLRAIVPPYLWVFVEEWAAQLVENHAIEASVAASETLGRPLCIGGVCIDKPGRD